MGMSNKTKNKNGRDEGGINKYYMIIYKPWKLLFCLGFWGFGGFGGFWFLGGLGFELWG